MSWGSLNLEQKDILDSIIDEWNRLLEERYIEQDFHSFIETNSALCWGDEYNFSISKLNLTGDYTPDFVLVNEKGSLGLQYTLVEIEKPTTIAITKQNNPASGLTHAQKQIRDWKNWIEKNSQKASELFPSKFSHDSIAHIQYMLVAGKRESLSLQQQLELISVSKEVGYSIRSFDFITDNLKKYYAREYANPNSDISKEYWEGGLYHKLACPFFKSITNKDWKSFATSPSLVRTHMISSNLPALLEILHPNEKLAEFNERLSS